MVLAYMRFWGLWPMMCVKHKEDLAWETASSRTPPGGPEDPWSLPPHSYSTSLKKASWEFNCFLPVHWYSLPLYLPYGCLITLLGVQAAHSFCQNCCVPSLTYLLFFSLPIYICTTGHEWRIIMTPPHGGGEQIGSLQMPKSSLWRDFVLSTMSSWARLTAA